METSTDKNALHEGYLLHWYEIKRVIGRGGFGITYLAHDNNLDRSVAIKEFMPEDFATRESDDTVHPKTGEQKSLFEWGLEHFIKEAQTLAKFNHPNIVHVLSVFEENNTAYMVMEYAHGDDLSTIYKKKSKFTEEQFLDIFIPILDGLTLVHNSGFIHRDIKPANIYICDDDSPLLLDFGSARQPIEGKTKALTSLVTFGYAPFEQYSEGTGKQGPWTDIYSLGACIYSGITGNKPIDALCRGGSFLETGVDSYQPLSIIAKGEYSENFLLAIDNALTFKIAERPQNVLNWANMLLGKTLAPKLPESMLTPPADDKTIVQSKPAIKKPNIDVITTSSRGSQGLVDSHGNRHTSTTSTMLRNRSRNTSVNSEHFDHNNSAPTKGLKKSHLIPSTSYKSRLPMIAGGAAVILLAAVLSIIFSNTTPEADNVEQEAKQLNQQLSGLLDSANQAMLQKKYVIPEENNAYHYYQQALKIEPNNERANNGIREIKSQLLHLAKIKYENEDVATAKQYLVQLDIINPNSKEANQLINLINNRTNKTTHLGELLNKADEKLNKKEYVTPVNDNAFYYYQQALKLIPDNQNAKNGINAIEEQLYLEANIAYQETKYKKSQKYLTQLKSINPKSEKATTLQDKIHERLSQPSQIASLLSKATKQKKRNRYTSPKNDNAFDTYKQILQLEPSNKKALDGLNDMRRHYKVQFNRHISAFQFSRAETDIRIMKKIGTTSSSINRMQTILKTSRQSIATTHTPSGQLDIHQASKKIGQFKSSIEKQNKNKLNNISTYLPGRKQFIDQLFSQYNHISVKVSHLNLIPKEGEAKAKIELTNLVDISGNKVTPGSWNKFEITIRYDSSKQLKVYW